ncbi:TPA: IS3 family transposase, partial [Staphylococcus aureus]|nr:IS3 family transposase [Staphylococcus aureus]
ELRHQSMNTQSIAEARALLDEFEAQMDEDVKIELFDYVNWYNNFRPHSSLKYLTAVAFKNLHMKTV